LKRKGKGGIKKLSGMKHLQKKEKEEKEKKLVKEEEDDNKNYDEVGLDDLPVANFIHRPSMDVQAEIQRFQSDESSEEEEEPEGSKVQQQVKQTITPTSSNIVESDSSDGENEDPDNEHDDLDDLPVAQPVISGASNTPVVSTPTTPQADDRNKDKKQLEKEKKERERQLEKEKKEKERREKEAEKEKKEREKQLEKEKKEREKREKEAERGRKEREKKEKKEKKKVGKKESKNDSEGDFESMSDEEVLVAVTQEENGMIRSESNPLRLDTTISTVSTTTTTPTTGRTTPSSSAQASLANIASLTNSPSLSTLDSTSNSPSILRFPNEDIPPTRQLAKSESQSNNLLLRSTRSNLNLARKTVSSRPSFSTEGDDEMSRQLLDCERDIIEWRQTFRQTAGRYPSYRDVLEDRAKTKDNIRTKLKAYRDLRRKKLDVPRK